MAVVTLDGHLLRRMILMGASVLEQNREAIDALNVFPVPDGDTGTNMSLTMMVCAKEVQKTDSDSVSDVAAAAARGALKGARGNSGVILSQLLRGFARGAEKKQTLTADEFAACLTAGAEMAYKSVMKPREGTILTVARVVAEEMTAQAGQIPDFDTLLEKMMASGEAILRKTPDMLPVLKKAGVVDAGGRGLLTIYLGYQRALGKEGAVLSTAFDAVPDRPGFDGAVEQDDSIEFGYCTEFFVRGLSQDVDQAADTLRDALMKIGDCVLVIGDYDLLKVHVHTNHPGQALEHALALGSLHGLKIENMREQHTSILEKEAAQAGQKPQEPPKPHACVAVAAGEGIAAVFQDLGVEQIVYGGQTMNPSTDDFLKAIEDANAQVVYILPNNSNIILAAQQAAQLCADEGSCDVRVIPTKTIPQGMNAMLAFVPENSADENEQAMAENALAVKSGKVTYAVRDSQAQDQQIHQGDYLGMFESDIVAVKSDLTDAVRATLDAMTDEDSCVISAFYGQDVSQQDAQQMAQALREAYPDCDVDVISGGQPVYYYLFSVE